MNTPEPNPPTPEPKLTIPDDFTGELTIEMPTGILVKFLPKRTTKGREANRWAYPSMVEDTSKMPPEECITSYALMLGAERIKGIIEQELDQLSQYFWRLAESDESKFTDYFRTGKVAREIVDPSRLIREAAKLHKDALAAKTKGDMATFEALKAKSRELKLKATELLTKEDDYNE